MKNLIRRFFRRKSAKKNISHPHHLEEENRSLHRTYSERGPSRHFNSTTSESSDLHSEALSYRQPTRENFRPISRGEKLRQSLPPSFRHKQPDWETSSVSSNHSKKPLIPNEQPTEEQIQLQEKYSYFLGQFKTELAERISRNNENVGNSNLFAVSMRDQLLKRTEKARSQAIKNFSTQLSEASDSGKTIAIATAVISGVTACFNPLAAAGIGAVSTAFFGSYMLYKFFTVYRDHNDAIRLVNALDVENLDEIFEITSLIVTTLIEKELENIIRTQFKNENSFIFNPDKILRIIDNILEHGLNFKNYRKYAGYEQLRDEEKLIIKLAAKYSNKVFENFEAIVLNKQRGESELGSKISTACKPEFMSKDPRVTNQTYQTRNTLTNFLYSIGMVASNDKKLKPFATESFIETLTTLKEKAAENTEDEFQPNPRLMPLNHFDTYPQPYHSVPSQNPMMSQGFSPQPQYPHGSQAQYQAQYANRLPSTTPDEPPVQQPEPNQYLIFSDSDSAQTRQYADTHPFAQMSTESSAHTRTNPFLPSYEDSSSRFFRHTSPNHDNGEALQNQLPSSLICSDV